MRSWHSSLQTPVPPMCALHGSPDSAAPLPSDVTHAMQLTHEVLQVHTKHPFIIARGGTATWSVVWVRLRDDDGHEGWGEAAPSRFYGETSASVVAALDRFAPLLAQADGWSLEAVEREIDATLRWNAAAKVAVSAALHDLHGKRLGAPLWKIWGLVAVQGAAVVASPSASRLTTRRCALAYVMRQDSQCSR